MNTGLVLTAFNFSLLRKCPRQGQINEEKGENNERYASIRSFTESNSGVNRQG